MKLKWCEYCFSPPKDDEIPNDFTLIWEAYRIAVYNCPYCGAYFLCPQNKDKTYYYRTRKPLGTLLDYIKRALDNETLFFGERKYHD